MRACKILFFKLVLGVIFLCSLAKAASINKSPLDSFISSSADELVGSSDMTSDSSNSVGTEDKVAEEKDSTVQNPPVKMYVTEGTIIKNLEEIHNAKVVVIHHPEIKKEIAKKENNKLLQAKSSKEIKYSQKTFAPLAVFKSSEQSPSISLNTAATKLFTISDNSFRLLFAVFFCSFLIFLLRAVNQKNNNWERIIFLGPGYLKHFRIRPPPFLG